MRFWDKLFGRKRTTSSLPQVNIGSPSIAGDLFLWKRNEIRDIPGESNSPSSPSSPNLPHPPDLPGNFKGKDFEYIVETLLREVAARFPSRVTVVRQALVRLNDGRAKYVDFAFTYTLASSRHQIAIECQDRKTWSTEIIDKILAIRNHSYRNRFWFVYHEDTFLTDEAKSLLDKHGIIHFPLSALRTHLDAVAEDVRAVKLASILRSVKEGNDSPLKNYRPPGDSF